jgi:AraC family transcriptional regulator
MKQTTLDDYKGRMLRVLVHIQQNLDEPVSLEKLAAIAAFSPYHFHRIFRGMVGESVKEHIRRLRLERAAARLKLTDEPISRIALEAGYESHEAFTRAFRVGLGLSPSEFRAHNAMQPRQPTPRRVSYQAGGSITDFEPVTSGGETMQVEIKKLEPMRVAFVRHTGPYNECGSAWEKLGMVLGQEGLLGGAQLLGLCHDDPEVTPGDKIRYDACCTLDGDFQPQGDIGVMLIEGGEYAMATHFGPFEGIGDTYARLFGEWLPRSGRELRSAPCLEIYLTDPENTEPEDYVTDIYMPLQTR